MKKLAFLLTLVIGVSCAYSQTFTPSTGTVSNKPYSPASAVPTDARSYYFDPNYQLWRPYQSTAEVLSYLNLAKYRSGQFDVIINTGGSLSGGVITGGTNEVWWFKNGTTNGDLVIKRGVTSVNGQIGIVNAKNADSLRSEPLDTTVRRNGYVVTYDSTNRKYYLAAGGTGGTGTPYAAGLGIDVTGTTISALASNPLWNASQLRNRDFTTAAPNVNQVIGWDGTQYTFFNKSIDGAFHSSDTLYIVRSAGDTIKVANTAEKSYVDSLFATIPLSPVVIHDLTLIGDGTNANPIGGDTVNYLAPWSQIYRLDDRIDSINLITTGLDTVAHDNTLTGQGTLATPLKVDSAKFATQSWVITNYVAPDGSETHMSSTATASISGIGTAGSPFQVTVLGTATANPLRALSLYDYNGSVPDAVVPVSGNSVTGTDCSVGFQAMVAAAAPGQLIVIPNGNWRISTTIDTIRGTRLNLLILGTVYTNGADFLRFKFFTGQDPIHRVWGTGNIIGRVNIPSHTSDGAGNRSTPQWSTFTGTAFTIVNSNKINIEVNRVEGFAKAYEVVGGGGTTTTWLGSQENHFKFQWLNQNAIGISLLSLNGVSYCDKTKVFGGRISGGLAVKFDGYSGSSTLTNNEVYNGAFRSNEIHALIERVDSIANIQGDATENWFDLNVELGTTTGVFGAYGYQMRSISPNYARDTRITGTGDLCTWMLTNGVGLGGSIDMPIYLNCSTRIGRHANIDQSGNIVVEVPSNLSQATRAALPAGFKTVNIPTAPDVIVTTTASAYTVAQDVTHVFHDNAAGTTTLPSASSFPTRKITIVDKNAAALAIANVASGYQASIPTKLAVTYMSDGVNWYPITSASTGTGSSQWTTSGSHIYYNTGSVLIGGTSPNAFSWLQLGASASAKALMEFSSSSAYQSVPRANSLDYNLVDLQFTNNAGVSSKIVTGSNSVTLTNKTWQGIPISPFYVDGSVNSAADYVLTTDGTTNGAIWAQNDGGFQKFELATTSATGQNLATVTIPDDTGGEVEMIWLGYRPSSNGLYEFHSLLTYVKSSGTLTTKGTTVVLKSTTDFTPALAFYGFSSNNFSITVSSVTTEQVKWNCYVKVRPTFTTH